MVLSGSTPGTPCSRRRLTGQTPLSISAPYLPHPRSHLVYLPELKHHAVASPPLVGSDRKSGWGAIPGPSRRACFSSPLCSSVLGEYGGRTYITNHQSNLRALIHSAGPGVWHPGGPPHLTVSASIHVMSRHRLRSSWYGNQATCGFSVWEPNQPQTTHTHTNDTPRTETTQPEPHRTRGEPRYPFCSCAW